MNKVMLMGRLTRDPEIRQGGADGTTTIAHYTLAVDRRFRRDGEDTADFINCVVFGKGAEFAEKYFHKGLKIVISGRIQTGSYTNRDGQKVYTTEVVVEDQEFAESKASSERNSASEPAAAPASAPRGSSRGTAKKAPTNQAAAPSGDFMDIPEELDDEELPFA